MRIEPILSTLLLATRYAIRFFVSPAECGALGDENAPIDPELAQLIESWSTPLPVIREAILAMLRAAE